MLCKKPFRKENLSFGCGQCTHCRINKVREWQGRLLLEQSHTKTESAFVTLTYDDEHLPNPPHVDKRHVVLFLKQLRNISGRKFRYYAVGEYGDQSWRPHYHLIVFGLFPSEGDLVQKAWRKGFVYMGQCSEHSASYVASYLIKRMTKPKDARLLGRTPEFSLKSQGIGRGIVEKYIKEWNSERGLAAFEKHTGSPPNSKWEQGRRILLVNISQARLQTVSASRKKTKKYILLKDPLKYFSKTRDSQRPKWPNVELSNWPNKTLTCD